MKEENEFMTKNVDFEIEKMQKSIQKCYEIIMMLFKRLIYLLQA